MKEIKEKFRSDLKLFQESKIAKDISFSCRLPESALKVESKVSKETNGLTKKKNLQLRDLGSYFLEPFIPLPNKPITFVCLNIHVFQNSQGGNNFQMSDIPRITQIINWVNGFFAYNSNPSDTVICNAHTIPTQNIDSRIRFTINRIEFYQDDFLNIQTYPNAHIAFANAMNQRDPSMKNQLNVFLTGVPTTPYVNTLPTSNPNDDSYVTTGSSYNGDINADWVSNLTLVHELGHVFGLLHTYNTSFPPPVTNESDNFYMFDIFGCGADRIIPSIGGWSTEPYVADRDGKNNNIMGGSYKISWISTLQIAQMHYHIQNSHVGKYVKCCQSGWRWCHKCEGMFYSLASAGKGICPKDHQPHSEQGSGHYFQHIGEDVSGIQQGGWRWCLKCQGLFYARASAGKGVCPTGGTHDDSASGHYAALIGEDGISQQGGWRWCHKCEGMFYTRDSAGKGFCPAGGAHEDVGSGHYATLA